jgi:sugar O-acyltransferase (sialic acid O-acetyltransferase NeuD family)
MKRLVIFGAGQIAEVAHYCFVQDSDYSVVGFTVDSDFLQTDQAMGLPLVAFEEVERHFPPDQCDIFIAMAFGKLNRHREAKFQEARRKGYRFAHYVSSRAFVWRGFEPKDNLFLLEHNTVQPFVSIGENTTLWSGNHIGHHATIGANVFIASHVVVSGAVTVGDNCFIGVNATLADNINIGARCLIGAGALLLQDAAEGGVYPATATERSKVPSNRMRGF